MSSADHPPGTLPPPSGFPAGRPSSWYSQQDKNVPGSYYPQIPSFQDTNVPNDPATHHHHHRHRGAGLPSPLPPPPPTTPMATDPRVHDPRLQEAPTEGRYGSPGAPEGSAGLQSTVLVAPPKIEMQPWARHLWRWLVDNTTGVARVDLRRPTPPLPEQYDNNILFVRSRQSVAMNKGQGRFGARRQQQQQAPPPIQMQYTPAGVPYGNMMYPPVLPQHHQQAQMAAAAAAAAGAGVGTGATPLLTGARIKITRSFLIGGGQRQPPDNDTTTSGPGGGTERGEDTAAAAAAEGPGPGRDKPERRRWRPSLAAAWGEKPLLDVGVGINLDMDMQQIQPVARIKIKDLVSIKAAPMGLLKISRSIPLGPVALKVRYELPLSHADRFWEPPARLMVRLDNAVGSGVHLTPGGIEFDEQVLQFGTAVSLRASAGLAFPRQLPLQEGEPLFRLHVNRLSLKSIW